MNSNSSVPGCVKLPFIKLSIGSGIVSAISALVNFIMLLLLIKLSQQSKCQLQLSPLNLLIQFILCTVLRALCATFGFVGYVLYLCEGKIWNPIENWLFCLIRGLISLGTAIGTFTFSWLILMYFSKFPFNYEVFKWKRAFIFAFGWGIPC